MADPFVAEIRVFGFNFAPQGWALCNGQILPISQNTALFALLGTTYGGDGKSTFALPNLQGSAALHPGQGPGLDSYDLGQTGGEEVVTLLESEMPSHNHSLQGRTTIADLQAPAANRALARADGGTPYQSTTNANLVSMAPQVLNPSGGSFPHNNMPPTLVLNFCIALQGVFPPRG